MFYLVYNIFSTHTVYFVLTYMRSFMELFFMYSTIVHTFCCMQFFLFVYACIYLYSIYVYAPVEFFHVTTHECLAAFTERNTRASTLFPGNNAGACSLKFLA
jgi:hypothetical protein